MKKMAPTLTCALSLAVLVSCDVAIDPMPTGSISVATSTTGHDLDPDGYTCRLDGGARSRSIGINETEVMADIVAGDHSVELSDVADNCTVGGDNPMADRTRVGLDRASRVRVVTDGKTCDEHYTVKT